MSGSSLPYHLRTNKAIDRQIFFDLLNNLHMPSKLHLYKYISLGGPMLTDHQSLHYQLGLTKLESIERDEAAFSRQNFNKPFGCIDCIKTSIADYVLNFDEQEPVIVWLDYVDTKWSQQFNECYELLSKLKEFDVFKVTFNANPEMLTGNSEEERLAKFKEKASSSYLSDNLIVNDVIPMDRLAQTIVDTFNSLVDDAIDAASDLEFEPLTIFRYIDNRHQMLTITGVVLPRKEDSRTDLIEKSHLTTWENLSSDWRDIHEINVPDLTFKERVVINQLLPADSNEELYGKLPFKLDKNDRKGLKAIANYIKYYRYMPHFQKLAM